MSKSKDAYSYGGGLGWYNVNSRYRCPICQHNDWCSIHRSGEVAICRRVTKGVHKVDRQGVHYWCYLLKDKITELPPPVYLQTSNCAPLSVISGVYKELVSILGLSKEHREHLRSRGLKDNHIDRAEYCTLPPKDRAKIAKTLANYCNAPLEIPGIYRKTENGKSWLSFTGPAGILIPIRNLDGDIVALKVRRDESDIPGPKYTYISSNYHGGPSPSQTLHWPLFEGSNPGEIRFVEGPLKADICNTMSPTYSVGLPSANSWLAGIYELQKYEKEAEKVNTVRIAFDSDWETNPHVNNALTSFKRALKEHTTARVFHETWKSHEGKGLDDYLLNKRKAA